MVILGGKGFKLIRLSINGNNFARTLTVWGGAMAPPAPPLNPRLDTVTSGHSPQPSNFAQLSVVLNNFESFNFSFIFKNPTTLQNPGVHNMGGFWTKHSLNRGPFLTNFL